MMNKRKQAAVLLSKRELIHLRRFLNRMVELQREDDPALMGIAVWYYAEPILKKVQSAFRRLVRRERT